MSRLHFHILIKPPREVRGSEIPLILSTSEPPLWFALKHLLEWSSREEATEWWKMILYLTRSTNYKKGWCCGRWKAHPKSKRGGGMQRCQDCWSVLTINTIFCNGTSMVYRNIIYLAHAQLTATRKKCNKSFFRSFAFVNLLNCHWWIPELIMHTELIQQ